METPRGVAAANEPAVGGFEAGCFGLGRLLLLVAALAASPPTCRDGLPLEASVRTLWIGVSNFCPLTYPRRRWEARATVEEEPHRLYAPAGEGGRRCRRGPGNGARGGHVAKGAALVSALDRSSPVAVVSLWPVPPTGCPWWFPCQL